MTTTTPAQSIARRRGLHTRRPAAGWLLTIATLLIAIYVLLAVLGPVLAPQDPNAIDFYSINAGSSAAHLLGTDSQGRDVLSRLLTGARPSLIGPAAVVLLSTAVGVGIALTIAWIGGAVDAVVSRALEAVFAFPAVLLAVLGVAVFGRGLTTAVLALSVAYAAWVVRLIRSAALREQSLPYVQALTVQGQPVRRILARHILPNLLPLVMAQATVAFGYAMVDLAALSFLGLGTQPPTPDWGVMISDGKTDVLNGNAGPALLAGLVLIVAVISVTIVGDRLARRSHTGPATYL